tara:strand:+ start:378 stop:1241 length:864 start_codon:yes stop_codon:yes gene_type:complete
MGLGEVFKQSFKDYKLNFKLILKIFLWLSVVPYILFTIFFALIGDSVPGMSIFQGSSIETVPLASLSLGTGIIFAIVLIINLFIGAWFYLSLYYSLIHNKKGKMSFSETAKKSLTYFWRALFISLIITLIIIFPGTLLGLTIAFWKSIPLIIGILLILSFIAFLIYMVYLLIQFVFSYYILLGENKKAIESLKTSKALVKGRWWLVLAYVLLTILIIITFSLVFAIPQLIIGAIAGLTLLATQNIVLRFILNIISYIIGLAANIALIPFVILFFKNLYLELKGEKKE